MEEVTEKLCNDFREHLLTTTAKNKTKIAKRLSQNAAHSYFNKFRAAVNKAFEERFLDENPIKRVKSISQEETTREFLTMEELNVLAQSECELPPLRVMALFSALTGLRWSDIVKLKWGDLQHSKEMGYYIHHKQKRPKE
jgi:integrase